MYVLYYFLHLSIVTPTWDRLLQPHPNESTSASPMGLPLSNFFASSRVTLPQCTPGHVTHIATFPPLLLPKCLQWRPIALGKQSSMKTITSYIPVLSLFLKLTSFFPPSGLYTCCSSTQKTLPFLFS